MRNRRQILTSIIGGGAAMGLYGHLPAWAKSSHLGNTGISALRGTDFNLSIERFPIRINGHEGNAFGVNGTVPAPLIRFREGDKIVINVKNNTNMDSSIHWHGLLVPFHMDGVPGVSFPGIKPGETFKYEFSVPQNGTYWYHSHSGLQEQMGHYGPIIIDPSASDPVEYDREYILVLSDWTFTDPHRIFAKLKKNAESLNYNQPTVFDPTGLSGMWANMRMNPRDISDVGGATYTYAINGHATADNFNMVYKPGEKIRLRVINASSMTFFNVRIPGLPMTVVQADGLNVEPVETDEFQIGVAETYDVIVHPTRKGTFAFVAEAIDRSAQAVATLSSRPGQKAQAPALRKVPQLTMKDMGMGHGKMKGMGANHMGHKMPKSKNGKMNNTHKNRAFMKAMSHNHTMPNPFGPAEQIAKIEQRIKKGPGVANIMMNVNSRLDEPGIGLDDVPHRTLRYSQLRSLSPSPDKRAPEREIVIHLTSNMHRYMWSFDGIKFSEIKEAIKFYEGERVRLTLVNDTMMPHPIHLHGMFFDLVIPQQKTGKNQNTFHPRKHTIIVKPAERLSVDITADNVGDWAFHCHLLYHMHAGMMQVVRVLPKTVLKNNRQKKILRHQHHVQEHHKDPNKITHLEGRT